MKKVLNILFILALTTVYTSCNNEVDDVFDKSSALRMQEALKSYKEVLVAPSNGWLMRYYGNTDYGGYNVMVKFNADNTVTVANEIFGPTETKTSHYKLEQSAGVVLSFDDYNELFHYFSDPDNPNGIGSKGKGMEGDLEFRIISATADEVVMKGKKHESKIVMTPINENWADYINKVVAVEENMQCANYQIIIGTDTCTAILSYRNMTISTTNEEGATTEIDAPFIVSSEGISFYEPIEIKGVTITGFKNVDGDLVYPEFSNSSVILKAVVPPINEQFVNNLWATSYSNLGEFGQAYWGYMKENVMPTINQYYDGTVTFFYFGKNKDFFGAIYGFIGYQGQNGFDYELIGDDEISLTYNSAKNSSNGNTFIGSGWLYAAGYLICPFGCTYKGAPVTRTFKLTTDNLKNPSEIILTDKDQEANTIRLVGSAISNPFDN